MTRDAAPSGGEEEPSPSRFAPLVIVETSAHVLGSHATGALVSISRAAKELGVPLTVASVKGLYPNTRKAVEGYGAAVVQRPQPRDIVSRAFVGATNLSERLLEGARRLRLTSLQNQITLAGCCLREVATLRVAARANGGSTTAVFVVQTASGALAGATAALARVPHVRVVHEVVYDEGIVLGLVERACRRAERNVLTMCPTDSVAARVRARHPNLSPVVHTFALHDADMRIRPEERDPARAWLGLDPGEVAGALVGGWHPVKDIGVVQQALALVEHPVALVIAGGPTDPTVIARMKATARGRIIVLARQIPPHELRMVYGGCDFTLVSRFPDAERKESGLVMDAGRYGVPLVVSDHDHVLNRTPAGADWARLFPAGDPHGLAAVLDEIAEHPLERPGQEIGQALGMMGGPAMIEVLEGLGARLAGTGR